MASEGHGSVATVGLDVVGLGIGGGVAKMAGKEVGSLIFDKYAFPGSAAAYAISGETRK